MIAAPDNAQVSRPAGANEVSFKVKGLMPGKTTFDVHLTQLGARRPSKSKCSHLIGASR